MPFGRRLLEGSAGALAVAGLGPIEARALGHRPVDAPERIAEVLWKRASRGRLSRRSARRAGGAMRLLYGMSWALLLGGGAKGRSSVWAVLRLASAISAFEALTLPVLLGVPLGRWSPGERAWSVAQAAAFSMAAVSVRRLLGQGAQRVHAPGT